ncbi:hypothetical protein ABXJ76_05115 [Methylobacter sp. G7]|uniref:hypothetical protein n=1 Tax=Methylobacter sp. G7 TaxID=3230117 RepID=UPI003D804E29
MKQIKVAGLVIVLIGAMTSNSVWARGGYGGGHYGGRHYGGGWRYGGYYSGIGLGLGLGYGLGYYGRTYPFPYYDRSYYSPYYAYPPAVIAVPVTPPVYIQQAPPVTQQYAPGYWYYCNNPEGYYPYIKQCPVGWLQVAPTPAAPR